MIDTLKVGIILPEKCYLLVRKDSTRTRREVLSTKKIELEYYNTSVDLPSWNRKQNIFFDAFVERKITLEFSVPKLLNNQNLSLITEADFRKAIMLLYNFLVGKFPGFPHYSTWEVNKLDICYAWRFPTQDLATSFLNELRHYHLPKHKNQNYDTSFMSFSQSLTFKMYLKNPEVKKHDFKSLNQRGYDDLANELVAASLGVLRFEISLRKKGLKRHFKNDKVLINDLNFDLILNVLKFYFYKMYPITRISQNLDLYNKLLVYYKPAKALRLYSYYLLKTGNDPNLVKTGLSERQIYYNESDLKKAGVANYNRSGEEIIDFNIPSKNVVSYLQSVDSQSRQPASKFDDLY